MKAALMWTINDFPAYGMLSGWSTSGKLACPYCMNQTKAFTLKYGGKCSWFDCHRQFLPMDHAYRRNKDAFYKKRIEKSPPPGRLSGDDVWEEVSDLQKITEFGPCTCLGSTESRATSKTQNNDPKITIYLDGQGFLPSHPAANGISEIFKSHFTNPWPSWKKIPIDDRDMWFSEFMRMFSICPPDERWARKNFEMRGESLLKNNLNKVRTKMSKPNWIGESVWDRLCQHWGTGGFKKKSTQAKSNRAVDCGGFGGSLHTGGSITTSQHRANLMKQIGKAPNLSDLFRITHQRKDKTWVDRRSAHIDAEFTRTWEEITQRASEEGTPLPNEFDVWHDVTGVKKEKYMALDWNQL